MTTKPEEVRELIKRLKRQAKGSSEAQRMIAEAKSARQADGGTYGWPTPEGTIEWKAATTLDQLLRENERLAFDKATVDAVLEAVGTRSVPTMDAVWSAGWNGAMDFVSKAIIKARATLNQKDTSHE